MRIFLLLLFLLCGSVQVQAQNKLTDSLLVALASAPSDSAKVLLNCDLSKQYSLSDPLKAIAHARSAEALANRINFKGGKAKALNCLGYSYLLLGAYDQALACHFKALKISEQLGDSSSILASYNGLGIMYTKIKDQDRSIHYYILALKYARHSKDQLGISKIYNNLGNVYEANQEYPKALTYFSKAAKLQETLNNKRSLAISLYNIGNLYLNFPQPEKGLPFLFKAIQLQNEIQDSMIKIGTLGSISKIYEAKGNNDKALEYARQSFELALQSASSKKISQSAQLLHTTYAKLKNYEQAYKYLLVYTEHEALLDMESQKKVSAEITAKHETEKKDLENKTLKAEKEKQAIKIKHQKIKLAFEAAIILLMLVLMLVLYGSRRRLKNTYLQLQQIHTHMQTQNREIKRQKNEISLQTLVLKEQNEQLEKHSLFKNKIFSIISHDLRAPFSSTKGILSLVETGNLSEAEVRHISGILVKDMDVALNMLNNLLVWSKTQLEGSVILTQPLNLHQLAEDNIQLFSSQAEQKNITLINSIAPGAVALADKERLNFVLRNLIMNALKYTFTGGEINVYVTEQAKKITIAVSDTGKGIATKNIEKLFTEERFTTLGTSSEKGTGLGLMLCKEFMQSLSGYITVESKVGVGSTFYISLPKAAIPAAQKNETEPVYS